jgi:hypothetical protein
MSNRLVTKLRASHCAAEWSQTTAQLTENRRSAILCLSILHLTIRSLLCGDILQSTFWCALLCLAILWTTDCPHCSPWRYYYRISALPTFGSALSGNILHLTILCALLCLLILHGPSNLPTIRSNLYGDTTNDCHPLFSTCPYYKRLSALPIIRYVGVLPFLLGIWFSCFLQLYGLGGRINLNCVEARLNHRRR